MKLGDLTPERRHILLAEAAGWTDAGLLHGAWMGVHPEGHIDEPFEDLPSFDTDLNACHDLEAKLTDEQRKRFKVRISIICCDDYLEGGKHWSPNVVHASAQQRASALLLTLVEGLEP